MIKLSKKDFSTINNYISDEFDKLRESLEDLEGREFFSPNQKAILLKTHGANFFKTKSAIERLSSRDNYLFKLSEKLEQLREQQ